MDPRYGKHCKRLAGFAGDIADAQRDERKHLAERDLAKVALSQVKEERRDAIIRGELGEKHRPVEEIDAEIKAANEVVEKDDAGAKAEAAQRRIGRLESDREAFIRENTAALTAEIAPHADPAVDAVVAAMGALEDAVEHRAEVAADLDRIVRLVPAPDDRSTYRMTVPEDRVGGILRGAISRARAVGVKALVPWEIAQGAVSELDARDAVDEDVEPVVPAQERLDALVAEREQQDAERAERAAAQLAAAMRKTGEPGS